MWHLDSTVNEDSPDKGLALKAFNPNSVSRRAKSKTDMPVNIVPQSTVGGGGR